MTPTKRQLPEFLFLFTELIFYILILTAHGQLLVWSSFLSIVMCFFFAVCHFKRGIRLFIAGLFCTVCADFFLVVCDPVQRLAGMVCFLCAQCFYAVKLHCSYRRKWLIILRIALSAVAVAITYIVLGSNVDALAVISVCYYANLILNIVSAFLQFKRYPHAAIGFCLFLLCDTVIGLQVASGSYLPLNENTLLYSLLFVDFNLAWLFYLPSQVLIALCAKER